MNTKFSVKQLVLIMVMAVALTVPRYPRYATLNTKSKLIVSGIYAISLIIVGWCVVLLVLDYLKNEKVEQEWWLEEKKEINSDIDNVKNVVINHNYEKVNQKYQWWYSKYENIKKETKNTKFIKVSIDDEFRVMQRLRELENCSFEEFIEELFKLNGYKIDQEPNYSWKKPNCDWWKDLIMEKDNKIYYVQIKKYFRKMVPLADLQAFNQVLKDRLWFFVTVSVFSEPAKKFASDKHFKCYNYENIWNAINRLSLEDKQNLENFINDPKNIQTDFEYQPRTCSVCWAPMKYRKSLRRYGCLRYPECKCTEFLQ